MGAMKRWYEDNIKLLSDEELIAMGYPEEDIEWLRECFSNNNDKAA